MDSASASNLQLEWSVVPRAKKFLESLRPYVRIEPPVSATQDFSKLCALSKEEQSKRLRQLDAEGQTINAIYLARRLYGCSLAEAKARIEGLREQKGAGIGT
jgi:ribosomal protein L7/L12